jgi:hypothetical protein
MGSNGAGITGNSVILSTVKNYVAIPRQARESVRESRWQTDININKIIDQE